MTNLPTYDQHFEYAEPTQRWGRSVGFTFFLFAHLYLHGYKQLNTYSIMMLMKFSDLSQSDRSNWVMWQVKDPLPDLGGTVVWPEKNGFHKKYKNLNNIAVYLIASLKSKWKNKQIKNMNNWIW